MPIVVKNGYSRDIGKAVRKREICETCAWGDDGSKKKHQTETVKNDNC